VNSVDSKTKPFVDSMMEAEAKTMEAARAWDSVSKLALGLAYDMSMREEGRESFTEEAFHARRKANIILSVMSDK
jgi:hypothetical protein